MYDDHFKRLLLARKVTDNAPGCECVTVFYECVWVRICVCFCRLDDDKVQSKGV